MIVEPINKLLHTGLQIARRLAMWNLTLLPVTLLSGCQPVFFICFRNELPVTASDLKMTGFGGPHPHLYSSSSRSIIGASPDGGTAAQRQCHEDVLWLYRKLLMEVHIVGSLRGSKRSAAWKGLVLSPCKVSMPSGSIAALLAMCMGHCMQMQSICCHAKRPAGVRLAATV